ncbi:hypothetical protein M569_02211 [Genlisea aurea]|uniref:Uncharacterized protein n=1 Tax=Genlisea aurea TaxID=192259 RepID=S8D558_9LAMI|nr:hypothetical protein M569_02211 [Genlisea aurea]
METLVYSHHKSSHQYYRRSRGHEPSKDAYFASPPSDGFRGITCRAFESGGGLLPTPFSAFSDTTPVNTKAALRAISPSSSENRKGPRRILKSRSVPVPIKFKFHEDFLLSERWAGPAYSISPPPSSLPLPKFSVQSKRMISFDREVDLLPMAKSAPASPVRESSSSPGISLFEFSNSATKTLRRILNLDIADE